jgi:putative hemolysin
MNTLILTEASPVREILLTLLCVGLRGFFVLGESALNSSGKPRLRSLADGGKKNAKKALEAAENPGPFLFTFRAWIILTEIIPGILGGFLFGRVTMLFALLAALVTILLMIVLGDILPRQIAHLAPERITAALIPVFSILKLLSVPLIRLSSLITEGTLAFLRLGKSPEPGMTEDELRIALLEGERSGIVESEERTMVEGVFYLGDRPVETFMTHRSELKWLDINAGADAAKDAAVNSLGQNYFPVAAGSLDKVTGLVSARDILLALLDRPWPGLKPIMKPPRFIPKTMSALKAFESFKREETDFLCVMDEYGGFAGVLTVGNLVEEIVGELSASAEGEEEILRQEDGTWLADGSVNMDEIAGVLSITELLGEHQEYHTLAGFILQLAGEIPRTGAVFEWNGFRFKIVDMDGNRIDKLLIYPPG